MQKSIAYRKQLAKKTVARRSQDIQPRATPHTGLILQKTQPSQGTNLDPGRGMIFTGSSLIISSQWSASDARMSAVVELSGRLRQRADMEHRGSSTAAASNKGTEFDNQLRRSIC